jgi:carbonic anhydrase/acetyltransferase-like protein (isoleucine patch superfamily)
MKAYMVRSKRRIEPFGDHPRDCLIVNRPLSDLQEEALKTVRLDLVPVDDASSITDTEEHLIFGDHLYFSAELLSEFISRSRRAGCRTVAALKPGIATLRTVVAAQDVSVHPDRVEYDLHYVPGGQTTEECQAVIIDEGKLQDGIPFPEHLFGGSHYTVPLTEKLITQIDHWTNLWSASIATLLAEGARLKKGSKLRLLWLALKARSTNQWKVLRQINKIGHGCDIHPTAYIEGCTIGNNVKIGAMAVVRESVVGDGAYIANNAAVELSVIGDRCAVQGGAVVQYSVLYPGVLTTAQFVNASMCGRDSFIAAGAVSTDYRFDGGYITVLKDGARLDTGNAFLGACLGHGTYVGSGCIVAPGRAIPNGLRITPGDGRVLNGFNSMQHIDGFRITKKANGNGDLRAEEIAARRAK